MPALSRDPAGTLILAAMITGVSGTFGGFFDTAWHRTVGRDSFFVLPHLLIYGAVVAMDLAVLAAAILASRQSSAFAGPRIRLRRLSLPIGFAIMGLGALTVMASAGVDEWYHRAYGKDVLIWSPPHLMAHGGALIIATGLLFAAAAQRERGWFRSPILHRTVLLLLFVELTQRMLFLLAHYTMIPESRTPDYYPFLVAVLIVPLLIASARVLGPWAPVRIGCLYLALVGSIDLLLWIIDFLGYTLTPLIVIPALAATALLEKAGPRRERWWMASAAALLFMAVFYGMESLWMAWVVGRPWSVTAVLAGLPRSLLAAGASAWGGWALGGFLLAVGRPDGLRAIFGTPARAAAVAGALAVLVATGLWAIYQPDGPAPPASVKDLGLVPLSRLDYREAVFWEAMQIDRWWLPGLHRAHGEGVIDGYPVPVGPGWCAADRDRLGGEAERVRFGLVINGEPVELSDYPRVRLRQRDGRFCEWVGLAISTPRPGRQRFVYTLTYERPLLVDGEAVGPGVSVIEMDVVLKSP